MLEKKGRERPIPSSLLCNITVQYYSYETKFYKICNNITITKNNQYLIDTYIICMQHFLQNLLKKYVS